MMAGIGLRAAATPASILDALARAGGQDLRCFALPDAKARHPAVIALAAKGFRIVEIPSAALATIPTLTESAAARAAFATGSVAEACALAAAGPGARLAAPRAVSLDGMATAAIALTEVSK